MSTLYVDIDDTLVRWLPQQVGSLLVQTEDAWEWNEGVREYVREWPGQVIFWSGGGESYAWDWAHRAFPERETITIAPKHPNEGPGPSDVVIDDERSWWGHAGVGIHPDAFAWGYRP